MNILCGGREMKRSIVFILICTIGLTAQAWIPSLLIDDLNDTGLAEYVKTVVLDQNVGYQLSFQSPSGTLQLTGTANGVEQAVLLRDDYSLAVGQLLVIDLAWGNTLRNDIGIVVGATKTPPAVAQTATGDVRQDYIAVYVQADNANLKGVYVNGTTAGPTIYAGGLPTDPKIHVTGLYIRRDSATDFALGFIVDGTTYTDFTTGTITNVNIGNAVGFFGDFRNVTTYGDLDNLRLESELWSPHNPSPADGSPAAGTALGDGTVDVPLSWAAGLDPANESQVNPIITKELVFLSNNPTDPNLYYLGTIPQTGILNPSFPLSGLVEVTDYRWSIVETVTGYDSQTFTVGQSTLEDVDPNNILGPIWAFKTAVGVDRRLVGEYLFENNLNDNTSEGNNGNEADPNKPTFDNTDPIDGYYAVFNGTNNYVNFGTAAYPKAGTFPYGVGGGMEEGTITCWIKPSQIGGILSNYNDGTTTGFALSLADNNGNVDTRMNARGESGDVGTVQGRPGKTDWDMLGDGQWHMVAATWKWGETMTVYVDGGQVASVAAGTPTEFADWQRGVLLGTTRNATDRDVLQNFLGGFVDTLRIYNYVRTPEEIATEYYTVSGNMACTDPAFAGSEVNFDNSGSSYCRIDLADFAVFASGWLADGLY